MAEIRVINNDNQAVQYLCQKDKRLKKLISMVGKIEYYTHTDNPYEFIIHEIIEQMLSIKVGYVLFSRLKDLCNGSILPEEINHLSDEQLKSIGISNAKVKYIRSITNDISNGKITLNDFNNMTDDEIISSLTSVHGIGPWTAKMYLIFVLDRPDVLPFEDGAFIQSYKWLYKTENIDKKLIINKCQKWKPYSSVAARYMYRALDLGLTKEEFHLYK